jgi:hypothetical protein
LLCIICIFPVLAQTCHLRDPTAWEHAGGAMVTVHIAATSKLPMPAACFTVFRQVSAWPPANFKKSHCPCGNIDNDLGA